MSGSCDDLPAPPCYISSRSADVILSDVRPTKLSIDALDAINALLDELLHIILSAARALTTAQLRAGLHKVLPTILGKEAVLEAELELRAYLERTGAIPPSVIVEDNTFNLDWTFELLRLKCEAYSTLSDTDENADGESRLFQRMNAQGIPSPKQTLLAPASLYLTAIIESICEHIVSNVGRVAARDSSRAIANGQDLFIALCEDSSIYGLFKNMTVYGRIEALSKMSRVRRSVSLAHESDGTPFRRNGSRLSSDSANNAPHSSRPSVDRARSVKLLYHKVSQDLVNGADPGHRKMDSYASASTKQSLASKGDRSPISPTFSEDTRSLEFDDMMRSGSTMKVSLTPDRLRTMEVLNKEKARANALQRAPSTTEKSNGITSNPPPEQAKRASGPSPTVRRAGSLTGSDDDRLHKPPPQSRPRQLSAATASGITVPSFSRVRASSTTTDSSTARSSTFLNNLSESASVISDQRPAPGAMTSKKSPPQGSDLNTSQSSRIRSVPRSRGSLDLEDIMTGSDDGIGVPKSPKQRDSKRGLSASTKELIAFLAEGPPESPSSEHSPSSTTFKKSGRLQKMISRITLASDTVKPPRQMTISSGDPSSRSMTNLSPLANRPVPPRYPTSGPSSTASSERGSADQAAQRTLEIDVTHHVQPMKPPPSPTLLSPQATFVPVPVRIESADATPMPPVHPPPSPPTTPQYLSAETASPLRQERVPLPVPSVLDHAQEMRAMLDYATSAAECRILVDMFLARAKLVVDVADLRALSAAPPPRDSGLERVIVELFLGDGEFHSGHLASKSRSAEPLFEAPDTPSIPSANRLAESSEPC